MALLTFGEVVTFREHQYVWLVVDTEEEKIHLALILDSDKTKLLIQQDDKLAKRHNVASDSPVFAYVVLTSDDFNGRAAHLFKSDGRAEYKDDFTCLGKVNENDCKALKKRILSGQGVTPRLVNLIKKLNGTQ